MHFCRILLLCLGKVAELFYGKKLIELNNWQ